MKKTGKYSGGLFVCVVLILSLTLSGCSQKTETIKESELAVKVAAARVQDLAKSVRYPGLIRGKNEVYIMPKVAARVNGIYVKPGDPVKAGQTLMTLDSKDYTAMVQQAEAGVSAARTGVTLAEAGQNANNIQLETARLNLERTKKLFAAGAASQQMMEAAQSSYDILLNSGADARVAQAQAGLAQAQASLAGAQNQMSNYTLSSPISGVVGSVNLSLGDTASPQSIAAIVTDTGTLEIEIMVNESEVTYIQPGSSVEIEVKATGDKIFPGRVDSIAMVADPGRKNYAVKIALPNKNQKLRSGMFAEVKVDTISKKGIISIPINAVIPKSGGTIVYTIDKNNKVRPLEVEIGIKNDTYVEITKGLKVGQKVITQGNTLVNDGTLVRVVAGGGK